MALAFALSRSDPVLRFVRLRQRFVPRIHAKWQVPKQMVGPRLSQEEAKRLLAKFE